ncbi:MAG TPA: hypothetical protein VND65_19315 [Candidatus Binatia bacterium]|nr:hypothetical protein [Candidatus Binatia bacterium]
MPGKRKFDEQLAALDALRHEETEARVEPLRRALAQRNNLIVAKAAGLVVESKLRPLIPELLAAFERFFEDPVKNDPQCWAKNAISRVLAEFEYQDAEVFLRGMKHVQLEPVWGGSSDSAGPLRSTCVLALVQCRDVNEQRLLNHLVDMLGDKEKSVRVDVLRAIEQVGSNSAALLLRMRAVLGSEDAEVLGACYSGILRIEGPKAIPWISQFLDSGDDAAGEAALAISGTHMPEAFEVLRARVEDASDPWFRSVLLSAIALTRQDAATEYLFKQVERESRLAEAAVEAILRSAPSKEVIERLKKLTESNPMLARAFAANRPSR